MFWKKKISKIQKNLAYLNNQLARFRWKKFAGEFIDIKNGVRQGGILLLFLFKILYQPYCIKGY